MPRGEKKSAAVAAPDFAALIGRASKAALIDALWCASQLGTNESDGEITAQAARNLTIALRLRGDRVQPGLAVAAAKRIDSDPTEEYDGVAW